MVTVGVFDSGIGGLSVLREIVRKSSADKIIYLADNLNHPYGELSQEFIQQRASDIVAGFISMGASIIVVACNTASGAALQSLRDKFSQIRFVGMEPAVKPACENSRSNKVAILATSGTLSAMPYASVVERFAEGVEIFELPCSGLAEAIEQGRDNIESLLRDFIEPILDEGVDQIALACTHYPLVYKTILNICGGRAEVIDPAAAVARQLQRLIGGDGLCKPSLQVEYYASGNAELLKKGIGRYLDKDAQIRPWQKV